MTTKSIPRSENNEANELVKAAAQSTALPSDVFYETMHHPSTETLVKPAKLINAVQSEDWRAPIVAYLKGYLEPESKEEENRTRQRA